MRLFFAIVVAVFVFGLAGCNRPKEGANYVHVDDHDAAMNAAIQKAKDTVEQFVQAFGEHRDGTSSFCVKKPYPTPNGEEEHMWIEVSDIKSGMVTGTVANEAEKTKLVKNGQKVTFNLGEISDWKYQDGNKLVGGYTIRYFVERMTPQEREAFLKEAGFEL